MSLRSGHSKYRRKVLLCDDCNLSIIICFWSDIHIEKLNCQAGSILVGLKIRVSDFYHKSLNANEDSQIFINPAGFGRANQLKEWYKRTPDGQTFSIHPLSGSLDVESKTTESAAHAQQDQSISPSAEETAPAKESGYN